MSDEQERSYFDEFIGEPRNWVVFEQERLAEHVSEFVLERLDEIDAPQAMLAQCLNKSPAAISRLLSKGSNMTLRTIVELVAAVGYQVELKLNPIPAAVADWWLGTEIAPCRILAAQPVTEEYFSSVALKAPRRALSPTDETAQELLAS